MSAAAFRARSATELIDATFQLLRRHAAAFFTLSALFTIPNAILASIFMPQALLAAATPANATPALGGIFVYTLSALALSAVFQTAMMIAASDAYLSQPVVVAEELRRAAPKAFTVFVAYIVTTIFIGIASIFFLVPGIYVALVLFAVPTAIIFEHVDLWAAFSRSSTLSKGIKGHVFLTFFLAAVVYLVGYFIVFALALMAAAIPGRIASLIVNALGTTLILPIFPIVVVLIYYDARIRKEGFDIELMARQVGAPGTAA